MLVILHVQGPAPVPSKPKGPGQKHPSPIRTKTRKNTIVECLDYQIPVTQLNGPRGDGDIQAAKRDCYAPATCDLNIWLFGRQTDLRERSLCFGSKNRFFFCKN